MTLPLHYFFHYQEATTITGTPIQTAQSNWVDNSLGGTTACFGMNELESCQFDVSSSGSTSGWISVLIGNGTNYGPDLGNVFILLSGETTDLVRVKIDDTTSGEIRFEYWNGSSWTLIGSNISFNMGALSLATRFDIRFIIADSGGEFSLYIDGSGTASASLTGADTLTTADTTIDFIELTGIDNSQFTYFSCLIMDSADTRDLFVEGNSPSSDGSLQQWNSGFESFIDDFWDQSIAASMSDVISTNESGDTDTYNMNTLANSGKTIEGVVLQCTAQGVGDPALFIDGVAYISSTSYRSSSPSIQPSAVSASILSWEFENDPSTSLPWANEAAIDATQFGFITDTS